MKRELTKEQIELALKRWNYLLPMNSEGWLRSMAPFLQLPWEYSTPQEAARLDSMFANCDAAVALDDFIGRRNDALGPKLVEDPRIERLKNRLTYPPCDTVEEVAKRALKFFDEEAKR